MEVVESLDAVRARVGDRPVAVTFGVFDGIHLGHQDLIRRVVAWARDHEGLGIVLTFANHPLTVLAPVYAPKVLTPRARRLELIADLGVDIAVAVEFTRAFANLAPERFVRDVLLDRLGARAVFLGFNNRFGKGGAGDTALLRRLGMEWGFEVAIVPPTHRRDAVVSSTRVRELLAEGHVRWANELLGRPHRLEGVVVEGAHRGVTIGFPTANLKIPEEVLIPCGGVYAVRAQRPGKVHGGMMNIGVKPTFEAADLTVEVHLFGFEGDLYGETLAVDLIQRMRAERKFESAEALRGQLERDRQEAEAILAQGR